MGVKYNHTKFDQETQRWRPGTGFASGGPPFQNSSKMAKKSDESLSLLRTCGEWHTRDPACLNPLKSYTL